MVNKIILILALFMVGCNPIKKAERTVLNNLESSERVFRELEKTRPCANDTTIMTKYDTTLLVDTLTNYQRDTITINDKEYITIKEAGKTIVKTIKVNQIHTGYIVDTRRVGILLDSVRYLGISLKDSNKTSNKWMWRFWALFGILIGYILIKRFLWSYLNILH
jgi:hypothetical protein